MSDSSDFTPAELERFKKLAKILAYASIWGEYLLCIVAFIMLFFAQTINYAWIPLLVAIISKTGTVSLLRGLDVDDTVDEAVDKVVEEDK